MISAPVCWSSYVRRFLYKKTFFMLCCGEWKLYNTIRSERVFVHMYFIFSWICNAKLVGDLFFFVLGQFIVAVYLLIFSISKMNLHHDIIMSLTETPFSRRTNFEKINFDDGSAKAFSVLIFKGRKGDKEISRAFRLSWYDHHIWMCGSVLKEKNFCCPCLIIGTNKTAWSEEGFSDWENLSRSAKLHENSKMHLENVV